MNILPHSHMFKSFTEEYMFSLSMTISEFLEIFPVKTRFDNRVVNIKDGIVNTKDSKYYISNPKLCFDMDRYPYFNIQYYAWKPRVKHRGIYNKIIIYRTEILDKDK